MRAVIVDSPGDPEVLRVVDRPEPKPSADEVVIKIAAAGVNRPDLLQRAGAYPPPPGASDILGLECSGHIAAVGESVEGWRIGDSCVALLAGGGYAEYVAVPAAQVIEAPDGVDLVTAAGLMEVAATVASNLELARLSEGETFLVHGGAGGIGSFAIQYAKALGSRVIATAGSSEKLDYCRSIGADLAVSYRDDWAAAAAKFTERGVNVILDIVGAKYFEANVDVLAPDGRLVIIGLQGGRKATVDLGALLAKRCMVICTVLRPRPVEQKAAICRMVAAQVWPLYASGRVVPAPSTQLPLTEAVEAHRKLESGSNIGKIVLVP